MIPTIPSASIAHSSIIPPAPEKLDTAEAASTEVKPALTEGGADKLYRQVSDKLLSLNTRLAEARVAANQLNSGPIGPRIQAMNENIEATHLHSHQVQMILEGLAKMPVSATEGKSLEDVKAQIQDSASKAPGLPTTPPEMNLQANAAGSDDFFAELIEMITFIREGYLGIYENLITKYSAFFKEFNEAVTSKMGGWITGANEGKDVKIDPGFRIALQALIDKYSAMPQGILFPAPNADGSITGVSREEALKWAATFGMDPSSVVQDASGKYVVMMDLSPIKAMRDSLPTGDIQWDSAKFQAWQTGFNSQESELKNQLQVFTTKYGNANSYYENFNKILSSQLSSFAEVLKAYISS